LIDQNIPQASAIFTLEKCSHSTAATSPYLIGSLSYALPHDALIESPGFTFAVYPHGILELSRLICTSEE
jgi:hypothetical protein